MVNLAEARKLSDTVKREKLEALALDWAVKENQNRMNGYEVAASRVESDGYGGMKVTLYLEPEKKK